MYGLVTVGFGKQNKIIQEGKYSTNNFDKQNGPKQGNKMLTLLFLHKMSGCS